MVENFLDTHLLLHRDRYLFMLKGLNLVVFGFDPFVLFARKALLVPHRLIGLAAPQAACHVRNPGPAVSLEVRHMLSDIPPYNIPDLVSFCEA